MQPEKHSYLSQRLELNYVCWGDPAKPALILVHGTRDHARSWDRMAEALVDRYWVVAVDLRGHGDSAWAKGGDYSIIDYALDLHALAEHLGRETYTLIGHSLGGGVALEFAGACPERVEKLVTLEGLGGLGWRDEARQPAHVRMRRWMENMQKMETRAPHIYASIEEAAERMRAANRHLTPELARHLTAEGVREVPGGYVWKFDNYTHAGSPYEFNMEDARDLWNQIRCPILILYGDESWGRRFPGGLDLSPFHDHRIERIEQSGHWVHHDQFEVVMRHINEFLGSMNRALFVALGLSLVAVAAAACGGDDNGDDEGAASSTAQATATPADPLEAYAAMDLHQDLADGDSLGDPAAPVTLTLFEDFQCPFCLAFNLAFEQIIIEEYVATGDVLLQFRHFTILGEESEAAAQASICAAAQNVFWPFHNSLFLAQAQAGQLEDEQLNVGRFSDENLRQFAVEAGADGTAYDSCRADPATLARLQEDFTTARTLGLRGTPGVVLDGTPVEIPRDEDELRDLLDEALGR